MKMTMHIDEDLLARVMEHYDIETKTEAVEFALKEMDRRAKWKKLAETGLGLTPEELGSAVDPNYDLMALRAMELPPKYGKKRPRR